MYREPRCFLWAVNMPALFSRGRQYLCYTGHQKSALSSWGGYYLHLPRLFTIQTSLKGLSARKAVSAVTRVQKYKRPMENCLQIHRYFLWHLCMYCLWPKSPILPACKASYLNKYSNLIQTQTYLSIARTSTVSCGPAFLNNSENPGGLVSVKANHDCSQFCPGSEIQIHPTKAGWCHALPRY